MPFGKCAALPEACLMWAAGAAQEGLPCKDGEHCAYAHDVSKLDIQFKSKICKVCGRASAFSLTM